MVLAPVPFYTPHPQTHTRLPLLFLTPAPIAHLTSSLTLPHHGRIPGRELRVTCVCAPLPLWNHLAWTGVARALGSTPGKVSLQPHTVAIALSHISENRLPEATEDFPLPFLCHTSVVAHSHVATSISRSFSPSVTSQRQVSNPFGFSCKIHIDW